MSYTLVLAPRAMNDLELIKKSGNQARIQKVRTILSELREHPLTGTGKPEQLRHRLNCYSRRISVKDRIVYSIYDDIVEVDVLQMLGHYNDK